MTIAGSVYSRDFKCSQYGSWKIVVKDANIDVIASHTFALNEGNFGDVLWLTSEQDKECLHMKPVETSQYL